MAGLLLVSELVVKVLPAETDWRVLWGVAAVVVLARRAFLPLLLALEERAARALHGSMASLTLAVAVVLVSTAFLLAAQAAAALVIETREQLLVRQIPEVVEVAHTVEVGRLGDQAR